MTRLETPIFLAIRASRRRSAISTPRSQVWVDLGIEAGLLVASSSPVGGQIADGISLSRNVAGGNYGAAVVDAIGFIPFGGDAIKGLLRGRSIARRMRQADEALGAARAALSRAQTFARRRVAASQYWGAIKRRRDAIKDRYRNCRRGPCADERDRELERQSNLPSRQNGEWRDANGNRVPAGEGNFVPNPGTRMHDALSQHQNPVTGIPYSDGQPDLSGFPPLGRNGAAPDGRAYSVEIDQSLTGDRNADAHAAWQQRGRDYPGTRNPSGGHWHHTGDGVTMQYVDENVHGALSHQGGVAMNTSPGF